MKMKTIEPKWADCAEMVKALEGVSGQIRWGDRLMIEGEPYTDWNLGVDPMFDAKVAFRALGAKDRLGFLAWAMTLLGMKVLRRADIGNSG
jgi:hypothetical protein